MQFEKIEKYFGFLSSIALLVGIVLIIFELRQNQEIARVELIASSNQSSTDLDMSLMDTSIAQMLAKVLSNSSELTDSELLQFDAFAQREIQNRSTRVRYYQLGLFENDGQENVGGAVCFYFNNKVGRAYLESPAIGTDLVSNIFINELQKCDDNMQYLDFMHEEFGTEPNN